MTIAEELRAQGREQGIEQGIEQERQRARHNLQNLITERFGHLPEAIAARIDAADSDLLHRWLARVLTASSPNAVVEA